MRPHSSKENFYKKSETTFDDHPNFLKEKSHQVTNIDDIVNMQSPKISSMRSSFNDSPNSNLVALKSKKRHLAGADNEGRNAQGILDSQIIPSRSRLSQHVVKGTSREFMHNPKSGTF